MVLAKANQKERVRKYRHQSLMQYIYHLWYLSRTSYLLLLICGTAWGNKWPLSRPHTSCDGNIQWQWQSKLRGLQTYSDSDPRGKARKALKPIPKAWMSVWPCEEETFQLNVCWPQKTGRILFWILGVVSGDVKCNSKLLGLKWFVKIIDWYVVSWHSTIAKKTSTNNDAFIGWCTS